MTNQQETHSPDILASSIYSVESVSPKVINQFVNRYGGDENAKHWLAYGVSDLHGYPAFTFGAGPCAVMAFTSQTSEAKLAHLPYMFVDRSKHNHPKTNEERTIDELLAFFSRQMGWMLYIFALRPALDSPRYIELRQKTVEDLVSRFSAIGMPVADRTNKAFGTTLTGLILDPVQKKIKVCLTED